MRRIRIFDTTLRDGEQTPGVSLTLADKVEIAQALAEAGVDIVEAGFPIAGDDEAAAVTEVSVALAKTEVTVAALARSDRADLDVAARSLEKSTHPRMHVLSSSSQVHIDNLFRRSREEVVAQAVWAVREARRFTDDVEFSPQDATRSDVEFLLGFYKAVVEAGATVINVPDTVGYAWPWQMADLIRRVREAIPQNVQISVHCHDDLGLAVANSLAAVSAGADQVECTVNGIGERAGNAAMEEIVTTFRIRNDVLPFMTGIRSDHLTALSRLVSERTGVMVQPNKAVVGQNAFRHESGIHQQGLLKSRDTYEIIDPGSVGTSSVLVIGKHSGRAALRKELEAMGYELDDAPLTRVWRELKAMASRKAQVDRTTIRNLVERALDEEARDVASASERSVPADSGSWI